MRVQFSIPGKVTVTVDLPQVSTDESGTEAVKEVYGPILQILAAYLNLVSAMNDPLILIAQDIFSRQLKELLLTAIALDQRAKRGESPAQMYHEYMASVEAEGTGVQAKNQAFINYIESPDFDSE
jgi:hypothetical protein